MKINLYQYLESIYLENEGTNLEKNTTQKLIMFLDKFVKLWNESSDYFDFKEKNIIKKIFSPKEENEEIKNKIMYLKRKCINFIDILLSKVDNITNEKAKVFFKKNYVKKLNEIKDNLDLNQKISDNEKLFNLILNNFSAAELFQLFTWEIRLNVWDELEDLNDTILKFQNLVESEQLKKIE